jgi:hypothetical protein
LLKAREIKNAAQRASKMNLCININLSSPDSDYIDLKEQQKFQLIFKVKILHQSYLKLQDAKYHQITKISNSFNQIHYRRQLIEKIDTLSIHLMEKFYLMHFMLPLIRHFTFEYEIDIHEN